MNKKLESVHVNVYFEFKRQHFYFYFSVIFFNLTFIWYNCIWKNGNKLYKLGDKMKFINSAVPRHSLSPDLFLSVLPAGLEFNSAFFLPLFFSTAYFWLFCLCSEKPHLGDHFHVQFKADNISLFPLSVIQFVSRFNPFFSIFFIILKLFHTFLFKLKIKRNRVCIKIQEKCSKRRFERCNSDWPWE